MSRRLATVWSLLAVVALVACSSQTAVGTHPTAPVTGYAPPVAQVRGEPGYLALGDSIAFGYRPRPGADYRNPAASPATPRTSPRRSS